MTNDQTLAAKMRQLIGDIESCAQTILNTDPGEVDEGAQANQIVLYCEHLSALLSSVSPTQEPTLRERQFEWVLERAEAIVRYEHGKDAAYSFTQAWTELPDELKEATSLSPAPQDQSELSEAYGFIDDLLTSNPNIVGRSCLQNYARFNRVMMAKSKRESSK